MKDTYLRVLPFHEVEVHLVKQLVCLLLILITWVHLKSILFSDKTPSSILDCVVIIQGLVPCNLKLKVSTRQMTSINYTPLINDSLGHQPMVMVGVLRLHV